MATSLPGAGPAGKPLAMFAVLAIAISTLGSTARAQELLPTDVRAAADGITAEGIARDVEFLSSDALRGRQTPSEGLDRAAGYIAERLERAGLTPLGDDGTYLQHYDLREVTVDTTHGPARGRTVCDGQPYRLARDDRTPNADVGIAVDGERFAAILIDAFGRLP